MLNLSKKMLIRLLRDMKRIRQLQLAIEERYRNDEMKTPVHLCIGQEAVAVGVCANLKKVTGSTAITEVMVIIWPKAAVSVPLWLNSTEKNPDVPKVEAVLCI